MVRAKQRSARNTLPQHVMSQTVFSAPAATVDRWSFASVPVLPYSFAVGLATATGFTVHMPSGARYLITNYHVLSGKRPDTGAPVNPAGHLPDRVLVALPQLNRGAPSMLWRAHVQSLLDGDGRRTWAEHPTHGHRFDVVALPLCPLPEELGLFLEATGAQDVGIFPGSTVSIVGFPHGLAGPALSAIWKTGAVASEPDLQVDGDDFFWVDANTRSGMSGSPVIARRFGSYLTRSGGSVMTPGLVDRLVGVYAGRAPEAVDMTLGRVWRWSGVEELLRHAESEIAAGSLVASPSILGYFPESSMPSITNRQGAVQRPPADPSNVTVADILRQVVGADQRFGISLDRLQLAAAVNSACAAAPPNGTVQVPAAAAAVLVECLRTPMGWGYPPSFFQLVEIIEQTIKELEHPTAPG